MPFHTAIQRLLLIGHRLPTPPLPPHADPPAELEGLLGEVRCEHRLINDEAVACGHRYRSAFWALYLMAALAVLLAVLPAALGWSAHDHPRGRYAVIWGVAELAVIGAAWLIYRRGVLRDWQGQWLASRSEAEMVWYLPLAACLRDPQRPASASGWYADLFGDDSGAAVATLCHRLEPLARQALADAWAHESFVRAFAGWTAALLAGQRHYHQRVGRFHHALQHRVHRITAGLFALTAMAAAAHLFWHTDALLIATTAFPAFGAALHGALVQGESQRLTDNAERLDHQLAQLIAELEAPLAEAALPADAAERIHRAAYAALAAILAEHQDWHLLVRPHHLPLG